MSAFDRIQPVPASILKDHNALEIPGFSDAKTNNIRKAVIIGINDYRDPGIPKLSGAVNDATAIRQKLLEFGDFEIADEHFLTNANASYQSIRKSISDLLWKTDHCDLALFYFSGHGFQDGYGKGYIAPYDMYKNEPFVCGIDMHELRQIVLNSINKQCVLVILDCCYSGISTSEKALPDTAASFDPYFGNLSAEEGGEGKIIIASSEEDQKSREIEVKSANGKESLMHGIFTHHLLEGLEGRAADETGTITLQRLYKFVEEKLSKEGKQKPKFYAASASPMERIKIAVAPQQFENYLMSNLTEAKELIAHNYLPDLFRAADKLQGLLGNIGDNEMALELRSEIDITLYGYRKPVNKWIIDNQLDLGPKMRNVFREFVKLVGSLDFQDIVKLDKNSRSLLFSLCEVSTGEMDTNRFIELVQVFDNPVRS